MATAPRPRTTTRDPQEVGRRLAAWLSTRLPGARIGDLTAPASNGMSSETLLFGVDGTDRAGTGAPGAAAPVTSCALRLAADPAAYTVFPAYDMERQYRVMGLVAAHTDIPVPRVLWLETDPGPLGAPFFVMEQVHGRVPPDVMPYTYEGNWLHSATDTERAALEDATLRVLAGLHRQFPPAEAEFLLPAGDGSPLRRHVDGQRAYYAWVVDGLPPSPLIESAFERLETLWPVDEGPAVLCWGDARIGNIVYDGFEPAAVLDWEMAAFGPCELDLGWTIYLHRFFQDLTEASGLRGLPGLLRRENAERRYAGLTGHTPRDMDFHLLYAALRHAIVMLRIAYRQVHFGEVRAPADPDAMILHRASLEALVHGTYDWSGGFAPHPSRPDGA
ncbi:phosphotransferase family protein [Streptomyces sp. NBC_00859]|uniref:phosphotransferase family protein n=1 Tax=Streptomyces sp. NBC_00859 TaxID=2903682 RepID=UPI00386D5D56|nr:phosphotransferase family protein [Streptomyces sp. NBC_00859]